MEGRRNEIIEMLRQYVTLELLDLLLEEDSSSEESSSASSNDSEGDQSDIFLEELAVEAIAVENGDPLPKVRNFIADVVLNYTDEEVFKFILDLQHCYACSLIVTKFLV